MMFYGESRASRWLIWKNIIVFILVTINDGCKFGPNCDFECHCDDDTVCDSITGECPAGCKPGSGDWKSTAHWIPPWSGDGCQIGNIAFGKAVTSYLQGNDDISGSERLVDGQTMRFCTASDFISLVVIEIDLGELHVVSDVYFYHKDGTAFFNINKSELDLVLEVRQTKDTEGQVCDSVEDTVEEIEHLTCQPQVIGRYVRLKVDCLDDCDDWLPCELSVLGYKYINCSSQYPGYFGPGCTKPCHCQEACDILTGICSGCKPGWTDPDCPKVLPETFVTTQPIIPYPTNSVGGKALPIKWWHILVGILAICLIVLTCCGILIGILCHKCCKKTRKPKSKSSLRSSQKGLNNLAYGKDAFPNNYKNKQFEGLQNVQTKGAEYGESQYETCNPCMKTHEGDLRPTNPNNKISGHLTFTNQKADQHLEPAKEISGLYLYPTDRANCEYLAPKNREDGEYLHPVDIKKENGDDEHIYSEIPNELTPEMDGTCV